VLSPAASPPAVRETFGLSQLAAAFGGHSQARRARAKLSLAAGGSAAGDATAWFFISHRRHRSQFVYIRSHRHRSATSTPVIDQNQLDR